MKEINKPDFNQQPSRVELCKIEGLKKDRHDNLFGSVDVKDATTGEEKTLRWIILSLLPASSRGKGTLDVHAQNEITVVVTENDNPHLYAQIKKLHDDEGEVALHTQTLTVEMCTIDLKTPAKVVIRDGDGFKVAMNPKTNKPALQWGFTVVRLLDAPDSINKLMMRKLTQIAEETAHGGGFVYEMSVDNDSDLDNTSTTTTPEAEGDDIV